MKTIAIDIDGTWSLDPECFLAMHRLFRSYEWRVIIITGGIQPFEKLQRLKIDSSMEYYCTNGIPKQEYLAKRLGIRDCVFVDNDPNSLISIFSDNLE